MDVVFTGGVGDEYRTAGETSSGCVEGVVGGEGGLEHIPVWRELEEDIFVGIGTLTGKNMQLAVENHIHRVGKDMPCMALRNIWVKVWKK